MQGFFYILEVHHGGQRRNKWQSWPIILICTIFVKKTGPGSGFEFAILLNPTTQIKRFRKVQAIKTVPTPKNKYPVSNIDFYLLLSKVPYLSYLSNNIKLALTFKTIVPYPSMFR
jgi:hypothetical protein